MPQMRWDMRPRRALPGVPPEEGSRFACREPAGITPGTSVVLLLAELAGDPLSGPVPGWGWERRTPPRPDGGVQRLVRSARALECGTSRPESSGLAVGGTPGADH